MTPDTLTLLTTRRSCKKLGAPAPAREHIDAMLQAATQVPDHGRLTPYRFIIITDDKARKRYAKTIGKKAKTLAPLIIAVIASPQKGKKPKWEQHLTAGCAAYAIQLAAKAQGYDSIWLSAGKHDKPLRRAFACRKSEKIIALLMIGSTATPRDRRKNPDTARYSTWW